MPARMSLPAADRKQQGDAAEEAASLFLVASGLRLLARNARYPFGEIDLVMLDTQVLVFVEVRFRRSERFGGAIASVDGAKRRKLARAAQAWLGSHRQYNEASCRFDVVAVGSGADGLRCQWIRSAFTMDDLW